MELNWGALRPGQREAIDTIRGRVTTGLQTTALVLPTRYGKSDIARVASVVMHSDGEIACTLALSPNTFLRDQLGSTAKWQDAVRRYQIPPKSSPVIGILDKTKYRPTANGEIFLSTTIQLAHSQRNWFVDWIEHQIHETGLPVLVLVDECQTTSERNMWGQLVRQFTDVGAHVVLLTATCERADGERIPGFGFETIDEEDIKVWQAGPGAEPHIVHVKVFEGVKSRLRLIPDYEVKFSEAWTTGVLCKINRTPFDVSLKDGSGIHKAWLSELSESATRLEYGSIVRQSDVIVEGCQRFVDRLRHRRECRPSVTGIIYCGNDTDKDTNRSVNKHAKQIAHELARIAPELKICIATSAETEDAKAEIERWVEGAYDVLIVKQMASVGIDAPRCKVGLDLSATRTFAAVIQRLMRPATPWDGIDVMDWIYPKDVIFEAIWVRFIAEQGGEASLSDLALIDEYDKPREDEDERLRLFVQGVGNADFDDSEGFQATADRWSMANLLVSHFPRLLDTYSHAEMVNRLDGLSIVDDQKEIAAVRNATEAADAIRSDINWCADECIKTYMRAQGIKYASDVYGKVAQEIWGHAYDKAGWPPGRHLDDVDDLALLERVKTEMHCLLNRLSHG